MATITNHPIPMQLFFSPNRSRVWLLIIFSTICLMGFSVNTYAHGTVTQPVSRIYQCYSEGPETLSSSACLAMAGVNGSTFLYTWNEVNHPSASGNHQGVIPDGKLCSAGRPSYSGLDLARNDWVATSISSGAYTFNWHNTAAHMTQYYDFYITRNGYNPNNPLRWSDLEKICSSGQRGQEYDARVTCNIPARTGRHIIYSVWQRSDSPEAFYSCSDVVFGGGGSSSGSSSSSSSSSGGGSCNGIQAWSASVVYTAGNRVSYNGVIYEAQWWTQGEDPSQSGEWGVWRPVGDCGGVSSSSSSSSTSSSSSSSSSNSSSGSSGGALATVYQHCNYTGWSASLPQGSHTLGTLQGLGFVNDDASSIRVAPGYEAVLYQHDNFAGSSIVVSGDDNCFVNESFNDVASSMVVRPVGGGSSSSSSSGSSSSGGGNAGDRLIGYFAQWGVYARNYHVKNIHTSGTANKINHIMYAFGNVTNGQCAIGDSYADYDRFYDAGASVDGVSDTWDTGALRGSFNQLRKLKQMYPHIKIVWSFGGWTWSGGFAQAAANPTAFANSCYDLLNDPRWAGLWDGIDIDWEYPNACGLTCDSSGFAAYRNVMQALRNRFGSNFILSSALPVDPSKIDVADYGGASSIVNFYMQMTYDYFGAWSASGPTAPHSPLYNYSGIPVAGWHADNSIRHLMSKGVPANKILIGIGFYGRGWTGVGQSSPGGSATGPASGIEPGVQDYKVLKTQCPSNGNIAGTAYAHCGNNWWSYDTPATISGKMNYANQMNLGGAFFWELSGDTANGELVSAMKNGL